MKRRTLPLHRHLAGLLLAAALIGAPGYASPEEDEREQAADALKTILSRPAMNTIPREKAVLRLRDLKAARQLERFLDVPRVNRTVIWALTEVGDPKSVTPVLRALDTMGTADRTHLGFFVASFATPEVRAWLRVLDGDGSITNRFEKDRLRAARIRAGDAKLLEETLAALKSEDPDTCAGALLALGDTRRPGMVKRIAPFVADRRSLKEPAKSSFPRCKREKLPGGGVRCTETHPELATVAEVAIEAANRALRPCTMEQIAWWYELEKGPRFPGGGAVGERLRRYVAADRRAVRAKDLSAEEAVRRVFAALRASDAWGRDGARDVDAIELAYEKGWRVSCRVNRMARIRATVGRDGAVKVTRVK